MGMGKRTWHDLPLAEHFLVGVTDRDRNGQLEPQVFVMDMNTGKANSFAKVGYWKMDFTR